MRVIFLDVDGILVHSFYQDDEAYDIDPKKVALLSRLCKEVPDANVVITSSWRGTKERTPPCYKVLRRFLDEAGIPVIGDAPYIAPEFFGSSSALIAETTLEALPNRKMLHGTGRAAEIESWLAKNPVTSFVILDDDDWDWPDYGYDKHWVQPSWFHGGLQEKHIEQAKRILTRIE